MSELPFYVECVEDIIDGIVEAECMTKQDAERLNLIIKSYLAEHWTERENPRHEIMESVCASTVLERRDWQLSM